jgi:hypothetical protein
LLLSAILGQAARLGTAARQTLLRQLMGGEGSSAGAAPSAAAQQQGQKRPHGLEQERRHQACQGQQGQQQISWGGAWAGGVQQEAGSAHKQHKVVPLQLPHGGAANAVQQQQTQQTQQTQQPQQTQQHSQQSSGQRHVLKPLPLEYGQQLFQQLRQQQKAEAERQQMLSGSASESLLALVASTHDGSAAVGPHPCLASASTHTPLFSSTAAPAAPAAPYSLPSSSFASQPAGKTAVQAILHGSLAASASASAGHIASGAWPQHTGQTAGQCSAVQPARPSLQQLRAIVAGMGPVVYSRACQILFSSPPEQLVALTRRRSQRWWPLSRSTGCCHEGAAVQSAAYFHRGCFHTAARR